MSTDTREPLLVVRVHPPQCPHCDSTDIVRRTGKPSDAASFYVRYMKCRACLRHHIQIRERK